MSHTEPVEVNLSVTNTIFDEVIVLNNVVFGERFCQD
jgi:hypothetical protein